MKAIASLATYLLVFYSSNFVQAVSFDWANIGNPGNAADTTGFGDVARTYRISKHEVTNSQYVEFLNAVDHNGVNALNLYAVSMAGNFGGIENTGTTNGARYIAQTGLENNPVTFVSWIDSVRFINWLHNGQGSGSTEVGVYLINNGTTETRSAGARYFLPTENEWYKAAYHDPNAGAGGNYFDYANGSDAEPISDHPGDDMGAMNYFNDDGLPNGFNNGYAVSGTTTFPAFSNPLTPVGAYSSATSPYGTFDQNGNVFEWTETLNSGNRSVRGGGWNSVSSVLVASNSQQNVPSFEGLDIGFRIASIALLADFDEDGDVDHNDLTDPTLGWEARYGTDLNGLNFLDWQQEFGTNAPPLSAVQSVPESSTLPLLLIACAIIASNADWPYRCRW